MNSKPLALKILDWTSLILLLIASYMVFFYAPMELVMGNVQRVFYFHVATGWVGFLAFFLTVVTGTLVLRNGQGNAQPWIWIGIVTGLIAVVTQGLYRSLDLGVLGTVSLVSAAVALYTGGVGYGLAKKTDYQHWDTVSVAAVELGLMFSFINIATGSIWARPSWNTWWTWDPRLVTATIMELIYFAYLMLRQGIENPGRRARFAAVYSILGFVSVPISYFSIRIWRTLHPVVIGSGDPEAMGSFNMTPPMLQTFLFGLLVFTVIFIDLFWNRIRLGQYSAKVEQLKMQAMN